MGTDERRITNMTPYTNAIARIGYITRTIINLIRLEPVDMQMRLL
jgi:hypothetical protein